MTFSEKIGNVKSMKQIITKYFTGSLFVTFAGLIGAFFIGEYYLGSSGGGMKYLFLAGVLALLEISLSFDNAVINATVLKKMTPLWVHRFLTWGMLIAVFGMRLVFPMIIVSFVGGINIGEAINLALFKPQDYAELMKSIHHEVSAFGGSFLLLVALKFFFNAEKDHHWIFWLESRLSRLGKLEAIEIAITLIVVFLFMHLSPESHQQSILIGGVGGVITFILVDAIASFLESDYEEKEASSRTASSPMDLHKASLGMFLYLEVLDASFSFDGVIGAFAVTNNLFIIAIGLGIGAMFVRSLTLMMVEEGTLDAYQYLEHGAFWAVASLALIMFLNTRFEVPEIIPGALSILLIGSAVFSSRRSTT